MSQNHSTQTHRATGYFLPSGDWIHILCVCVCVREGRVACFRDPSIYFYFPVLALDSDISVVCLSICARSIVNRMHCVLRQFHIPPCIVCLPHRLPLHTNCKHSIKNQIPFKWRKSVFFLQSCGKYRGQRNCRPYHGNIV